MEKIICVIGLITLTFCSQLSPAEKELQSALQSTINLDNVSTLVYAGNDSITFDHLRQKYAFISLVYLQDGCEPCYPNFIRWYTEMQKLDCPENHILLFIINHYCPTKKRIKGVSPEGFAPDVVNLLCKQ